MAALQELCEKDTSDQQRSNLLVDIMNAMGFSKSEREITRHDIHLREVLDDIFQSNGKYTYTITGSASEGLHGGIYYDSSLHDCDSVSTESDIKLYTPSTYNINNPPLLKLDDNEDYDASFFVEEDDNFPGYVKLSLAEANQNSVYLDQCRRMNDDKLY